MQNAKDGTGSKILFAFCILHFAFCILHYVSSHPGAPLGRCLRSIGAGSVIVMVSFVG